ncbi:MAG TPA: inositol monophosphatase family protein [Acidimicrobiia bacterium]
MDVTRGLALALELAEIADAITVDRFRAVDLVVETKPDLTPVTEADQAVERALRGHLAEHAPSHGVLGEEYGHEIAEGDFRWIIDPIDGTKSYVRGVPVWATLIALEHLGVPVVGVVSAPALGTRWWAAHGLGAFRNGTPIRVSAVHELGDAQISFAWDTKSRYDTERIGDRMLDLAHRCWRTRGLGDFWQHALVAEGAFDISVDPIVAYWDAAALLPIIEEAGGRWSTVEGDRPGLPESLVCTNGLLHDTVVELLAPGAAATSPAP